MGGNATLFSEGSSNAIEPDSLNSAGRKAGPVFLPEPGVHALGSRGIAGLSERPSGLPEPRYLGTQEAESTRNQFPTHGLPPWDGGFKFVQALHLKIKLHICTHK